MRASVHRRPESVLVVIYTPALDCLLLQRRKPTGFWQSVTGSLEWGETCAAAARREVFEETGFTAAELVDARVSHTFHILPHYQDQYAPNVKENVEHVWYLKIPDPLPVRLDPSEHSAYRWLPHGEAVDRVSSWTNRQALERLVSESWKP